MKEEIHNICTKYGIENYTINDDGSIDVDGHVDLSWKDLERMPVKFREITGDFYCPYNRLNSLEGCPKRVGGDFYCDSNNLTTLDGCVEKIDGDFYCDNNNLTSLKGGPEKVGGVFFCNKNNLTSLDGCPKKVGGSFYCNENPLPKHIIDNPIAELERINRNNKLNTILN